MRRLDRRFDELSEVQGGGAEMEDRCALSVGMVALDGKLYPDQEVVVLLQSSPAKCSAVALRRAIKSDQSRPIDPQDRTHRTALNDQTYSCRASAQQPPALCQPLGKAESSTLTYKTMTSNAEKQSSPPAPPRCSRRNPPNTPTLRQETPCRARQAKVGKERPALPNGGPKPKGR
jgi:hypothetical protein